MPQGERVLLEKEYKQQININQVQNKSTICSLYIGIRGAELCKLITQ